MNHPHTASPYAELSAQEKERFFGVWPAELTAAETSLKQQVDAFCHLGSLLYAYVVQRGLVCRAERLPADIARGPKRQCYGNAMKLAFANAKGLAYVEGYALSTVGIAAAHAWCITEDQTVIDPTWDEPERCAYLGIPFNHSFLYEHTHKTGVCGVFGEMPAIDMLARPVRELTHPWFFKELEARPVWPELARVLGPQG